MTVLEIIEKTIMNEIICSTRVAKIMATAIVEELEKEDFELTKDTATIRRAAVPCCQNCGRDFISPELVYYAPLDGNIVCSGCAQVHRDRRLRIYVAEGRTDRG